MIEINLLPEDMRKTEGTPPARMLTIVGSVAAAGILGFFIGTYYMIRIPQIRNDNATLDLEIKNLKEEQKKVDIVRGDITALEQKVAALDTLTLSRVRFARLLNQLCNSVPDGVWFRSFSIGGDSSPSAGGKRYQISLTGYATGMTDLEMKRKLSDLMNNMKREFSVRPEDLPPNSPPDIGLCKFLNAKFDAPYLLGTTLVDMPNPDVEEKVRKTLDAPKKGLDFQMKFSFEMLPPKQG
jgi:type IV pilus assembly protein PilN